MTVLLDEKVEMHDPVQIVYISRPTDDSTLPGGLLPSPSGKCLVLTGPVCEDFVVKQRDYVGKLGYIKAGVCVEKQRAYDEVVGKNMLAGREMNKNEVLALPAALAGDRDPGTPCIPCR